MSDTPHPEVEAIAKLKAAFDRARTTGHGVNITGISRTLSGFDTLAYTAATAIVKQQALQNSLFRPDRHTNKWDFEERDNDNPLNHTIERITQRNR